tara:strand:- start:10940 stop:11407 length:468 start_codon:yes stop_codon:yes gene_type:complete
MSKLFLKRSDVEFVEEGNGLAPKFNDDGLIPVVVIDFKSKDLLMHGYMNREALELTINEGIAHYWSRSRKKLWRKGDTSGMIQKVREILIDDDQDAICLKVKVEGLGASCHVGYRSCFYRSIEKTSSEVLLKFLEHKKIFDPEDIYPGAENPTKL